MITEIHYFVQEVLKYANGNIVILSEQELPFQEVRKYMDNYKGKYRIRPIKESREIKRPMREVMEEI